MSLFNPAIDSMIPLRDGRKLGYTEVGKNDGTPIFHFHGSSSSRLEVKLLATAAAALGVRLIGLDRPGIGLSETKDGYRLLDWPDDVTEVADQLGIERFAVEGISAGGPYAMACAYKIPQRLTACGLISTVPPTSLLMKAGPAWMRGVWWIGEHFPGPFSFYLRLSVPDSPSDAAAQEKQLLRYSAWYGEADKKVLNIPELRKGFAQALAETRRHGAQGNRDEALRLLQPWGFTAEEITYEKVFLWHGEQDHIMPIAPARLLAKALPHCTATFYPNEGHLSLLANRAQDILKTLSS